MKLAQAGQRMVLNSNMSDRPKSAIEEEIATAVKAHESRKALDKAGRSMPMKECLGTRMHHRGGWDDSLIGLNSRSVRGT